MAIQIYETTDSRSATEGQQKQTTFKVLLRGSDDEIALKQALYEWAATYYDGMVIADVGVDPLGPLVWEGTVRYTNPSGKKRDTNDSILSFDTTGGTAHITQSLNTQQAYQVGGGIMGTPNFGKAIGISGDNVAGVDIDTGGFSFVETHYLDASIVTFDYAKAVGKCSGKINAAPFRGFQAGEVKFKGCRGTQRDLGDWELTFSFEVSFNATDLVVGDIANITKAGWDYLWVFYEKKVVDLGSAGKVLAQVPKFAVVEKVYKDADFSTLGIGS